MRCDVAECQGLSDKGFALQCLLASPNTSDSALAHNRNNSKQPDCRELSVTRCMLYIAFFEKKKKKEGYVTTTVDNLERIARARAYVK